MQLLACWKSLHPVLPMEKHVVKNEMEGISLDLVLDVMREIRRQKQHDCTFERICATFRRHHKNVSRPAIAALLEQAVTEKVVEKRVTNNVSSYQEPDSNECGGQKSATNKRSSLILAELSDAVVSTLAAEGSTGSKTSLSLKSIEQKISSEGKIHVMKDFDWKQNIRLVCKQLVSRGILQRQGASYSSVQDAGRRKLNAISEHAGITRGQKRSRVGFSKIADTDDRDVDASASNDCKLVSDDYRVIGEVMTSKVMHKSCSNERVFGSVQKAVMKRKSRTLLRHARDVGLKKNTGQKTRVVSSGKNLLRKKYQLRSSAEQTVDVADKPFTRQRKLSKFCKQYSLAAKQSDVERQRQLAAGKYKTSVKDADILPRFTAENFKQSSENMCCNTTEVLHHDKSYSDGEGGSVLTRRNIQNAKRHKSVQTAGTAVATSVADGLMGQPVVNLYRVESQQVRSDERVFPVDDNSNASNGDKHSYDINSRSASTTKTPSYQLASASELHGNQFAEVKKMLLRLPINNCWWLVTEY